jgi:transposase
MTGSEGFDTPRNQPDASCSTTFRTGSYSPDLNPIEKAFSKLKALLRKAAARTKDALWSAVAEVIERFEPSECRSYFTAAEYEPE